MSSPEQKDAEPALEARIDLDPCAGSVPKTQDVRVQVGPGCELTISLTVQVRSCGEPSMSAMAPEGPDSVPNNPPTPEMPSQLQRDAGAAHAFTLWSRGVAPHTGFVKWQPAFTAGGRSLSAFMFAENHPTEARYRGFGVANLKGLGSALVSLGGSGQTAACAAPAWAVSLSAPSLALQSGALVVTAQATVPDDKQARQLVVMPAQARGGASYGWADYLAQAALSAHEIKAGTNPWKAVVKAPTPGTYYCFVVRAKYPADHEWCVAEVDSPVVSFTHT